MRTPQGMPLDLVIVFTMAGFAFIGFGGFFVYGGLKMLVDLWGR